MPDKIPTPKGSYIVVYGSGIGNPGCGGYALETGAGAPSPPSGCSAKYTAFFGSRAPVPVAFGGWTPSLIGLAQWNIEILPMPRRTQSPSL